MIGVEYVGRDYILRTELIKVENRFNEGKVITAMLSGVE